MRAQCVREGPRLNSETSRTTPRAAPVERGPLLPRGEKSVSPLSPLGAWVESASKLHPPTRVGETLPGLMVVLVELVQPAWMVSRNRRQPFPPRPARYNSPWHRFSPLYRPALTAQAMHAPAVRSERGYDGTSSWVHPCRRKIRGMITPFIPCCLFFLLLARR